MDTGWIHTHVDVITMEQEWGQIVGSNGARGSKLDLGLGEGGGGRSKS